MLNHPSSPQALAQRLRDGWASQREAPPASADAARMFAQCCAKGAWSRAMEALASCDVKRFPEIAIPAPDLGLRRAALPIQMLAKGEAPAALHQALARGANPNAKAKTCPSSPLLLALSSLDLDSVAVLLDAGANPNAWAVSHYSLAIEEVRPLRRSPLTAVCSLVARKAGFGPAATPRADAVPVLPQMDLSMAQARAMACCEVLLDFGADIDAQDERGESPMGLAVNGNCRELIEGLASRGASWEKAGFGRSGFVGAYCEHAGEWVGGPKSFWGAMSPIDFALFGFAEEGLRTLIDLGAELTPPRRQIIAERAGAWRRMREQLQIADQGCPWLGMLAHWEARELAAESLLPQPIKGPTEASRL